MWSSADVADNTANRQDLPTLRLLEGRIVFVQGITACQTVISSIDGCDDVLNVVIAQLTIV